MGLHHHDSEASCFGQAVSRLLRARHPYHTAKKVAGELGCTVKAAENLLAGHLSAKSITRLVRAYGPWFLIDAGAAVAGKTLEQVIAEESGRASREREEWERRERELTNVAAVVRSRLSFHSGDGSRAI